MTNSIFDNLFDKDALFIDRYAGNPKDAVDIIIPIINNNTNIQYFSLNKFAHQVAVSFSSFSKYDFSVFI